MFVGIYSNIVSFSPLKLEKAPWEIILREGAYCEQLALAWGLIRRGAKSWGGRLNRGFTACKYNTM